MFNKKDTLHFFSAFSLFFSCLALLNVISISNMSRECVKRAERLVENVEENLKDLRVENTLKQRYEQSLRSPIALHVPCGTLEFTLYIERADDFVEYRPLIDFCQESRPLFEEDPRECVAKHAGSSRAINGMRICTQELVCRNNQWYFRDMFALGTMIPVATTNSSVALPVTPTSVH